MRCIVWLAFVCAMGALSIANSSEIKSESLELQPSTCTTFQFTIPKATQFNLTVDTTGMCGTGRCDPTAILMMTPIIRAGKCFAYKWKKLKCAEHIKDAGQLCAKWAEFGEAFRPSNATEDQYIHRTTYWECEETAYFIAFQSSDPQPLSIKLSVEVDELSSDEYTFCKYLGGKGKNAMELITNEQIIALAGIILIAFVILTLCICFQAPCCPIRHWIKNFSVDPDDLEEDLLAQEEEERMERQRRRAAKKRKDEALRHSPIPEESV